MRKAHKTIWMGIFSTVLLFFSTAIVSAQAVWVEGKVTDRQISRGIYHIQLDERKVYMLMKDCRVDMRIADRPGAYIEQTVDAGYIRKGQRVTIKAEDNRAFQVLILQ